MDIYKAIELYTRKDYITLRFAIENDEIIFWDVEGFEKPTIDQLETLYENWIIKKKKEKFRSERDFLLDDSDWITSRISKENIAISLGMMIEEQRKWTPQQISDYLLWCAELCELPNVMTEEQWNNISLDAIDRNNKNLFRDCPIDLQLTRLD